MSTIMKVMRWRAPAVFAHQRWIARQSSRVRFVIGAAGFCVVYVVLERWLGHGSALDHIAGMIGGALGFAVTSSWGPPRES